MSSYPRLAPSGSDNLVLSSTDDIVLSSTHDSARPLRFAPSRALRAALILCGLVWTAGCNDEAESAPEADTTVADTSDGADAISDAGDAAPEVVTRDAGPSTDLGLPPNCEKEDRLAPNQGPESASPVTSGVFRQNNLYVCPGADDWFAVSANAGQRIVARIEFAHRIGDLDMYLLPAGTIDLDAAVAVSGTSEDVEELSFVAPEAGTWFVVVDSFEDAVGSYEIQIDVSCRGTEDCNDGQVCSFVEQTCVTPIEPACGFDANEPNNTLATATPIVVEGDGFAYVHNFVVCEDDDDYFTLTLDAPSTVDARIQSDPGSNVDLYVFDSEGNSVASATSEEENPEDLNMRFLAAGTYLFVVDHFVTALGDDVRYNLTIEVNEGRCETSQDCGFAGRALCEEGACVSFTPESPNPAGGMCDDREDCAGDLGCYQGEDGFDDNFCTRDCDNSDACSDFEDGYCLALGRDGVCFEACSADTDCPTFYSCNESARCAAVECGVDADCNDGQFCRRSEQRNQGYCTASPFPSCGDDDYEDNDTDGTAVLIDGPVEGVVCDDDDDWFAIMVPEDGMRLDVTVRFEGTADIDVFVLDASGRTVGSATQPSANPEVADARFLAAGEYTVRVNQFPTDGAPESPYTLTYALSESTCTVAGEECLRLDPLRVLCEEDAGACAFIEGEGTVPLGGACDSNNDCVAQAAFCWVFEGAEEGRNVCSIRCSDDSDCGDVPDTVCTTFQGGFAACLPE